MKAEYDFSQSVPNPYVKRERKPVTLRLDTNVIEYFKAQAQKTGVPYQNLINLYLSQCAAEKKQLAFV